MTLSAPEPSPMTRELVTAGTPDLLSRAVPASTCSGPEKLLGPEPESSRVPGPLLTSPAAPLTCPPSTSTPPDRLENPTVTGLSRPERVRLRPRVLVPDTCWLALMPPVLRVMRLPLME